MNSSTNLLYHLVFEPFGTSSFLQSLPLSLPVSPCPTRSAPVAWQTTVSNPTLYISAMPFLVLALPLFLLVPMRLEWKQVVAAPILGCLILFPMIFVVIEAPALHMFHALINAATFMRMLDLYFVIPWRSGKEPTMNMYDWRREIWRPMRQLPEPNNNSSSGNNSNNSGSSSIKKRKQSKSIVVTKDKESSDTVTTSASSESQEHHGRPTEKIPERNGLVILFSNDQKSTITAAESQEEQDEDEDKENQYRYQHQQQHHLYHWTYFIPRWLFYLSIIDLTTFYFSFLTVDQIRSLPLLIWVASYILLTTCVISAMSLAIYSCMFMWAIVTDSKIDDREWTYVQHGFPLWATSPRDFWKRWHHLFQHIWVSLGAKSVMFLYEKYSSSRNSSNSSSSSSKENKNSISVVNINRNNSNNNDNSSKRSLEQDEATLFEQGLSVMSVFFLSAVLHEYVILSTWTEWRSLGYNFAYFIIQGVATLMSKALLLPRTKKVAVVVVMPVGVQVAMTITFNVIVGTLFLEPFLINNGFTMGAKVSVLVNTYNHLRTIDVF